MLRNNRHGYGAVIIAFHWLMAVMVIALFGLGLYMVELTYYDAWYKGSLDLHKSLGMLLLSLWVLRITWRLLNTTPAELPGAKWEQMAAQIMHMALYAFMLLLMISGYLISSADGRAIAVFEVINIPALPWGIDNQEDIAGLVHQVLAWLLITLVSAHALAAIKHHIINKDNGLKRILKSV